LNLYSDEYYALFNSIRDTHIYVARS
jgi:hypothetical protein